MMTNNQNLWVITPEDRIKLDKQFHSLNPTNGFITGIQAKSLFTKSNLSTDILAKIWNLCDYDKDGQMNITEFSVAMHLIKRKLEGYEVPDNLPTQLASLFYNTPMNFYGFPQIPNSYNTMPVMQSQTNANTMIPHHIQSSITYPSVNNTMPLHANSSMPMFKESIQNPGIVEDDWTMSQAVKPRYRLQFNQQDRHKRGYLTGVEAKAILVQSGLPQSSLAQIWTLADIDKDGNLTCEEFCIAMHLVDQARSGKTLPNQLPVSLYPSSLQRRGFYNSSMSAAIGVGSLSSATSVNGLPSAQVQAEKEQKSIMTAEDERRANYLKGQAELEKRRAILEEQMQMEEETRRAKEKAEFEKLEKIRLEKEEARLAEIQRQMEFRRQQELEREEQIRRLAEEREKTRLESEKHRLLELEKRRLEVAIVERRQEQDHLSEVNSKKGNLVEALANETEKKRDLQSRIETTQESVNFYKVGINSMREHRDQLMGTTDCLKEELQAAKAELSRCQREKQNLELQLQSTLQSDPVLEQIKTVQILKSSHKEKIKQFDKEIKELEQKMTKRGQKLATNRNKIRDIEKKVTAKLIADIKRLQASVLEKKNAALAVLKRQKEQKLTTNSDSQSIDSFDKFSAFRKPPSSNVQNNKTNQPINDLVYYTALYPFDGRQDDELTFVAGDKIVVDRKEQLQPNSGWLYGCLFGTTNPGMFPETFVQELSNEDSIHFAMEPPTPVNIQGNVNESPFNDTFSNSFVANFTPISSSVNLSAQSEQIVIDNTCKIFAVSLYPYESSIFGDLNIQPGEIIEILEQKEDWWKGHNKSTSQQGLFPSNYVRLLTSEESSKINDPNFSTSLLLDNQPIESSESNNVMSGSQHSSTSVNSLISSSHNAIYGFLEVGGGNEYKMKHMENDILKREETLPSNHSVDSSSVNASVANDGSSTPEIVEVMIDFTATSAEQLSLQTGQMLQVREKSTSGWWKGEIQKVEGFESPAEQRGQQRRIGWFPGDYVKSINPSQSIVAEASYKEANMTPPICKTPTPTPTPSLVIIKGNQTPVVTIELNDSMPGDQLITMYNYSAQNVDELSFEKNTIIKLIDKNEPEWWMGQNVLTDQEGLFPVNYVRRINTDNASDLEALESISRRELTGNSGKSCRPVSWYVDGTMNFNSVLTEEEKRRQFYIRELIETEKVYYEDLQEVLQIFIEPIKKSNLLTVEDVKEIFLNWTDLIANSYNFYMALKIRKDRAGNKQPIQSIGDILLSNFPNFIVYVRFCSMQNQAIAKLQKRQQTIPQFKELCEKSEANLRCQKMPMTSYFLKPMQRITKYKLLVENILKHTDNNHPDHSDMEEAVTAARNLCESVNEGVRERENSERLEWLQEHLQCDSLAEKLYFNSNTNCLGHRKILYSGTLYKAKSSKKELVGFLFNDFLLLATPCYNTGGTPFVFPLETSTKDKMQFKIYKKPIMLNKVMISSGAPTSGSNSNLHHGANNDVFTVKETNCDHILRALSVNDRDKWVQRLMNASMFYVNSETSKREKSMSMRRTAGLGRLILTLVEGINLYNSRKEFKLNPFCETSLGNQLHRTKVVSSTSNPKWNTPMHFLIKNIDQDVLCLTVYNKDNFAPNEFLGRVEVSVSSVFNEKRACKESLEKKLKLMEIDSGELLVRLDVSLFK